MHKTDLKSVVIHNTAFFNHKSSGINNDKAYIKEYIPGHDIIK